MILKVSFLSMLRLSAPISASMMGLMLMGLVDQMAAGRLGAWAMSAASLTHAVYSLCLVMGIGFMAGTEIRASQAVGAGRAQELAGLWSQSLWMTIFFAGPLTVVGFTLAPWLAEATPDPQSAAAVPGLFRLFVAGLWPSLLAHVARQLLQAQGVTRPGVVALVLANVVNLGANAVLVLGMAFPNLALGVQGTGWATLVSRCFMAVTLIYYLRKVTPGLSLRLRRPEWLGLKDLVRLGVPSATVSGLEVGLFAGVSVLAATLGAIPSAAHQTILSLASLTYMVPLGISAATTVMVGQSVGRQSLEDVRRAARYGVGLAAASMAVSATCLLVFPGWILGAFTSDPAVLELGLELLFLAGIFQVFDGIQVALVGALRGVGDTRSALVCNVVAYWLVAFPLAALFVKGGWGRQGYEIVGAWQAMTLGLVLVSLLLGLRWKSRSPALARS